MSGRIAFAFAIASSPLSTATICRSSLASVMLTTFWIVMLSSARSSVFGISLPSLSGPEPHGVEHWHVRGAQPDPAIPHRSCRGFLRQLGARGSGLDLGRHVAEESD